MSEPLRPEELIAAYCDLNGLYQSLLHKNYSVTKNLVREAVLAILEDQPDPDDCEIVVNCFRVVMQYHVFFRLLEAVHVELTETHAARRALEADFAAWKQNGTPGEGAWLSEAHPAVKLRLLKAMDALGLTPADFDVIPPEELNAPKWQKKSYGEFELVSIAEAKITDDGGLAADADPVGKDYVLTDADGCVYHLNGIRRSKIPGGLRTDGARHYAAKGWIEGYTCPDARDIEFEICEDGGFVFSYSTDGTADDAAPLDPRWQPYEDWIAEKTAARRQAQETWLAAYR